MPYSEVERLCANAGSLLLGAAFAEPASFEQQVSPDPRVLREAALLSRRTADGFKASLADPRNAVIAWPWDHLATAVAWEATRRGDTSEDALGEPMQAVGAAYALRHHDQLAAVLDLWRQVAAGVRRSGEAPDLSHMGSEMLLAFKVMDQRATGPALERAR